MSTLAGLARVHERPLCLREVGLSLTGSPAASRRGSANESRGGHHEHELSGRVQPW
jgi:hypothetical protein